MRLYKIYIYEDQRSNRSNMSQKALRLHVKQVLVNGYIARAAGGGTEAGLVVYLLFAVDVQDGNVLAA